MISYTLEFCKYLFHRNFFWLSYKSGLLLRKKTITSHYVIMEVFQVNRRLLSVTFNRSKKVWYEIDSNVAIFFSSFYY